MSMIPTHPPTRSPNSNSIRSNEEASSATRTDAGLLVVQNQGEDERVAEQVLPHHQDNLLSRGLSRNGTRNAGTSIPSFGDHTLFIARPTLPVMTIPVFEQEMINKDATTLRTTTRHQMVLGIIESVLSMIDDEEPLEGFSEGDETPF